MHHKYYRPVVHDGYTFPDFGRIGANREKDGSPKREEIIFFQHRDAEIAEVSQRIIYNCIDQLVTSLLHQELKHQRCDIFVVNNRIPPLSNFGRIEADRGNDNLPKRWWSIFIFNHKAQRPQSFFFFFLRAFGVLSGLTFFKTTKTTKSTKFFSSFFSVSLVV
jgi:hypothetical protein